MRLDIILNVAVILALTVPFVSPAVSLAKNGKTSGERPQLEMERPEAAPVPNAVPGNAADPELKMETPMAAPTFSALPRATNHGAASKMFSLGTSQSRIVNEAEQATLNKMKKASDAIVEDTAKKAFSERDYNLARQLYEILCERSPKKAEYFYGAGDAYYYQGDYASAFGKFVTAWHLADDSKDAAYSDAANTTVDKMKARVDNCFKLTYGYQSADPETILNAATRLWKAGFTKQSIDLNNYVLKNEPLYAQVAAYNLGATAEHNAEYKLALEYYQWAARRSYQIEAAASKNPSLALKIQKVQSLLPTWYIERAISDSDYETKGFQMWHGWAQANVYPKSWCSEVCPLCAISRTDKVYPPGKMQLAPAADPNR